MRVDVRARTFEQDVIPFWRGSDKGTGLHFTNGDDIGAGVETYIGVADEAIVAEDRHAFGFGQLDDANGFLRVMRNDDESFDVGVEKFLGLIELEVVAAIGVLQNDFRSKFLRSLLERIEVGLPALDFQGVY